MGDVYLNSTPRRRIRLRVTKGGRKGDVFLPDALLPKLKQFWSYKRRGGESLDAEAALFCNQTGQRISKRRVQVVFRSWQIKAGFDRLYPFHALRHTAVTNVYRSSRDLYLLILFAPFTVTSGLRSRGAYSISTSEWLYSLFEEDGEPGNAAAG